MKTASKKKRATSNGVRKYKLGIVIDLTSLLKGAKKAIKGLKIPEIVGDMFRNAAMTEMKKKLKTLK